MTDTRERILKATVETLDMCADIKEVTMRKVCDRAGVNTALVNYHFGSKEGLIAEATRKLISETFLKHVRLYAGQHSRIVLEYAIVGFAADMFRFFRLTVPIGRRCPWPMSWMSLT